MPAFTFNIWCFCLPLAKGTAKLFCRPAITTRMGTLFDISHLIISPGSTSSHQTQSSLETKESLFEEISRAEVLPRTWYVHMLLAIEYYALRAYV